MNIWNPWQGCKKISEGCKNCPAVKSFVIYYGNRANICKTPSFALPLKTDNCGNFLLSPQNGEVKVLTNSDFFIEKADEMRTSCWRMMKERWDLHFDIATRRVGNIAEMLPPDWGDGYENVSITALLETQKAADESLPEFMRQPVKHRRISFEPLLERVDISKYLDNTTELVKVMGSFGMSETALSYEWVTCLRSQCIEAEVPFWFGSTGENFEKDGALYRIKKGFCYIQAQKAGLNHMC